ncbi:hypothetical protein B178_00607 [Corynebacterium diphtheriae DSM 43988]|nr:hypothetical protein B178_00607 [Corynebacterium diphtheriae DSM 43988]
MNRRPNNAGKQTLTATTHKDAEALFKQLMQREMQGELLSSKVKMAILEARTQGVPTPHPRS